MFFKFRLKDPRVREAQALLRTMHMHMSFRDNLWNSLHAIHATYHTPVFVTSIPYGLGIKEYATYKQIDTCEPARFAKGKKTWRHIFLCAKQAMIHFMT